MEEKCNEENSLGFGGSYVSIKSHITFSWLFFPPSRPKNFGMTDGKRASLSSTVNTALTGLDCSLEFRIGKL